MRGVFEFEIEGKKRGFHFNFMAFGVLEEMTGLDLDELISKLSGRGAKVKLLSQFFFAGAKNYCDSRGQEVDFTINDVSDWVTEIGFDKAFQLIAEALGTKTPKNSKPHPEKVGI